MIHAEVLPGPQIACLRTLAPVATKLGFHLAGGTAVALTFGHRQSVDFDWFTPRFPGQPVDLATSLASQGVTLETTSLADHTVRGLVHGIRVTFSSSGCRCSSRSSHGRNSTAPSLRSPIWLP